jgi:hypothetical protein
MFSACFLFSVKRQVPAVSSTAVKGAQVHLMQQEEYMTVSLKKKSNCGFCGKVHVHEGAASLARGVHLGMLHEYSLSSKRNT